MSRHIEEEITLAQSSFYRKILAAIILRTLIYPLVFMLLWNIAIPVLLGLPHITFIQSIALCFLLTIAGLYARK